jgi:ABC-type Zn uptake system ZnuABC Zn-binding protein ZnuA
MPYNERPNGYIEESIFNFGLLGIGISYISLLDVQERDPYPWVDPPNAQKARVRVRFETE